MDMSKTENNVKQSETKTRARTRMRRRLVIAGLLAVPLVTALALAPYWGDWMIARVNRPDGDASDFIKIYQQFLNDIEANRLDVAYRSTTADFQSRVSQQEFELAARRYAAFKGKPDTRGIEAESSGPAGGDHRGVNRMVFSSTMEDREGARRTLSITVEQQDPVLDREPAQPRVDNFEVTDSPEPDAVRQAGQDQTNRPAAL
jgi:hypothetical protein